MPVNAQRPARKPEDELAALQETVAQLERLLRLSGTRNGEPGIISRFEEKTHSRVQIVQPGADVEGIKLRSGSNEYRLDVFVERGRNGQGTLVARLTKFTKGSIVQVKPSEDIVELRQAVRIAEGFRQGEKTQIIAEASRNPEFRARLSGGFAPADLDYFVETQYMMDRFRKDCADLRIDAKALSALFKNTYEVLSGITNYAGSAKKILVVNPAFGEVVSKVARAMDEKLRDYERAAAMMEREISSLQKEKRGLPTAFFKGQNEINPDMLRNQEKLKLIEEKVRYYQGQASSVREMWANLYLCRKELFTQGFLDKDGKPTEMCLNVDADVGDGRLSALNPRVQQFLRIGEAFNTVEMNLRRMCWNYVMVPKVESISALNSPATQEARERSKIGLGAAYDYLAVLYRQMSAPEISDYVPGTDSRRLAKKMEEARALLDRGRLWDAAEKRIELDMDYNAVMGKAYSDKWVHEKGTWRDKTLHYAQEIGRPVASLAPVIGAVAGTVVEPGAGTVAGFNAGMDLMSGWFAYEAALGITDSAVNGRMFTRECFDSLVLLSVSALHLPSLRAVESLKNARNALGMTLGASMAENLARTYYRADARGYLTPEEKDELVFYGVTMLYGFAEPVKSAILKKQFASFTELCKEGKWDEVKAGGQKWRMLANELGRAGSEQNKAVVEGVLKGLDMMPGRSGVNLLKPKISAPNPRPRMELGEEASVVVSMPPWMASALKESLAQRKQGVPLCSPESLASFAERLRKTGGDAAEKAAVQVEKMREALFDGRNAQVGDYSGGIIAAERMEAVDSFLRGQISRMAENARKVYARESGSPELAALFGEVAGIEYTRAVNGIAGLSRDLLEGEREFKKGEITPMSLAYLTYERCRQTLSKLRDSGGNALSLEAVDGLSLIAASSEGRSYTMAGHQLRVAEMVDYFCRRTGTTESVPAVLHDLGKVFLPERALGGYADSPMKIFADMSEALPNSKDAGRTAYMAGVMEAHVFVFQDIGSLVSGLRDSGMINEADSTILLSNRSGLGRAVAHHAYGNFPWRSAEPQIQAMVEFCDSIDAAFSYRMYNGVRSPESLFKLASEYTNPESRTVSHMNGLFASGGLPGMERYRSMVRLLGDFDDSALRAERAYFDAILKDPAKLESAAGSVVAAMEGRENFGEHFKNLTEAYRIAERQGHVYPTMVLRHAVCSMMRDSGVRTDMRVRLPEPLVPVQESRALVRFQDTATLWTRMREEFLAGFAAAEDIAARSNISEGRPAFFTFLIMDKSKTWLLNNLGREFGDKGLSIYFQAVSNVSAKLEKEGVKAVRITNEGDEIVFIIEGNDRALAGRVHEMMNREMGGLATQQLGAKQGTAIYGALAGFSAETAVGAFRLEKGRVKVFDMEESGAEREVTLQRLFSNAEVRPLLQEVGPEVREVADVFMELPVGELPAVAPKSVVFERHLLVRMNLVEPISKAMLEVTHNAKKAVSQVMLDQAGPSLFNLLGHGVTDALTSTYYERLRTNLAGSGISIYSTGPLSFGFKLPKGLAPGLLEAAVKKTNAQFAEGTVGLGISGVESQLARSKAAAEKGFIQSATGLNYLDAQVADIRKGISLLCLDPEKYAPRSAYLELSKLPAWVRNETDLYQYLLSIGYEKQAAWRTLETVGRIGRENESMLLQVFSKQEVKVHGRK